MRRLFLWTVVGVCALAAVTTAAAIADPAVSRESAPVVDASDDPASVAGAALAQTRYRDYTVTFDRIATGDRFVFPDRLEMDNTDREYLLRRPDDPSVDYDVVVEYGNPFRSWSALVPEPGLDAWRSDSRPWGEVHLLRRPIELEKGAVTTVQTNESRVVLNLTDTEAVYRLFFHVPNVTERQPGLRAHAVVTVDRALGAPLRVTLETVEPSGDGGPPVRTRTVMTFDGWDETDVTRPASIPHSMTEIAEDAAELDGRGGVAG